MACNVGINSNIEWWPAALVNQLLTVLTALLVRDTDRQTERERDRQTDRQRQSDRGTERDTHTCTHARTHAHTHTHTTTPTHTGRHRQKDKLLSSFTLTPLQPYRGQKQRRRWRLQETEVTIRLQYDTILRNSKIHTHR